MFKKAFYLAQLCDMQLVMSIYDPRTKRVAELVTHEQFDSDMVLSRLQDEDCAVSHVKPENIDDEVVEEVNLTTEKIHR